MTITRMDLAAANALRAEIEAAAQEIARKHGLSALINRCAVDHDGGFVQIGMQLAVVKNGVAQTREAENFVKCARLMGVAEHVHLGSTFCGKEGTYRVAGMASRGGKQPVLAERHDGVVFRFAVEVVNRAVARTS